MPKAIRVRDKKGLLAPMTTFIKKLGVNSNIDMYHYTTKSGSTYVYMDSSVINNVLNVNKAWFKRNANMPDDYIPIKSKTYINRYGLIKLIAKSQEPIARRILDYVYEAIYLLEKDGKVEISQVESRKALSADIEMIKLYQLGEEKNKETIKNQKDQLISTTEDLHALEVAHEEMKTLYDNVLADNEQLEKENIILRGNLQAVAEGQKLSKAATKLIDKQATKKSLNKSSNKTTKKTLRSVDGMITCYIQRGYLPVMKLNNNDHIYAWICTERTEEHMQEIKEGYITYDNYKEYCLNREENNDIPFKYRWMYHREVKLDIATMKLLANVLSRICVIPLSRIDSIVDAFI